MFQTFSFKTKAPSDLVLCNIQMKREFNDEDKRKIISCCNYAEELIKGNRSKMVVNMCLAGLGLRIGQDSVIVWNGERIIGKSEYLRMIAEIRQMANRQ